jgi:hypothetical protein
LENINNRKYFYYLVFTLFFIVGSGVAVIESGAVSKIGGVLRKKKILIFVFSG